MPVYNGTIFSYFVIIEAEVKAALLPSPLGKASGLNEINNRELQASATELSPEFPTLFNQSLQQSDVLDILKRSHGCPVSKGGDVSPLSNNRPISLLINIDKTFERIVFEYLYNNFHDNDVLAPLQSGFISGDSTVNKLAFLYDTFCKSLDSRKEVREVFCDISKAFDRVWHPGLIHKLREFCVSGNLLRWFENYSQNRCQRVVIPGAKSEWNYIRTDVPKRSILGPLLFLLYINDIVKDIGSNIRIFADDTSLFIIVENPEVAADTLNTDLAKWQLGLRHG